jgi:hypothetical protein
LIDNPVNTLTILVHNRLNARYIAPECAQFERIVKFPNSLAHPQIEQLLHKLIALLEQFVFG